MSRGLGETQLRALEILDEHHLRLGPNATGMMIDELGRTLSLEERRCRAVVASLADRDLVTVVSEGGPQRVWNAEARRRFVSDQAYVRRLLERLTTPDAPAQEVHCPNCGAWVETRPLPR